MLQIGVCDDDSRMASMYAQAAEESLRQCGAVGRVLSYTDSRNLLWDITEDGFFFDLLLLDIEMPGVTGMELAEKIRDVLPDIRIIFITSHMEYAIDEKPAGAEASGSFAGCGPSAGAGGRQGLYDSDEQQAGKNSV